MKKILLVALIISVAASCKKNSSEPVPVITPAPLAVTYAFSSTQNDAYTIKYSDTNAMVSTILINGNKWSKSLNIPLSKSAKLSFSVESADKSFDGTGNMSVAVEGQSTSSMPLFSSWDTYGMHGQIIYYPTVN